MIVSSDCAGAVYLGWGVLGQLDEADPNLYAGVMVILILLQTAAGWFVLSQNRKQRRQTAFSNSWWRWVEIDRFFVQYPHLKRYIYENAELSPTSVPASDDLKHQVDSVCEMFTDHWAGIFFTKVEPGFFTKLRLGLGLINEPPPYRFPQTEVTVHRDFARLIYTTKSKVYRDWLDRNCDWYDSDLLEWITGIDSEKWKRDERGCLESPRDKRYKMA